jgi:hypothetical protein
MPTNPYEPPREGSDVLPRRSDTSKWKRFRVIVPGIVIGFLFAIILGQGEFRFWGWIVGGPLLAMDCKMMNLTLMGWMGAMMAICRPMQPNVGNAFITVVGLVLWFLSGLIALTWLYST